MDNSEESRTKAILFVLLALGSLYAGGCNEAPQPIPREGESWFSPGDFLMVFQARSYQIRRVVVIGRTINLAKVHGPFVEEDYDPYRIGERLVDGEKYYVVGERAYHAPPGDLVLIHGWAEACVVVHRVPPAQLTALYRSVQEQLDQSEAVLRRLVNNSGSKKAQLLVDKLMTGEVVGTQWRDQNGIPAAKTIPYEELAGE